MYYYFVNKTVKALFIFGKCNGSDTVRVIGQQKSTVGTLSSKLTDNYKEMAFTTSRSSDCTNDQRGPLTGRRD